MKGFSILVSVYDSMSLKHIKGSKWCFSRTCDNSLVIAKFICKVLESGFLKTWIKHTMYNNMTLISEYHFRYKTCVKKKLFTYHPERLVNYCVACVSLPTIFHLGMQHNMPANPMDTVLSAWGQCLVCGNVLGIVSSQSIPVAGSSTFIWWQTWAQVFL